MIVLQRMHESGVQHKGLGAAKRGNRMLFGVDGMMSCQRGHKVEKRWVGILAG